MRLENGLTSHPDMTSGYASICRQKADQLERLVTDLFSYSQMSSLDQLLRPEPFHAADLFTEIVTEYQPSASEKAIQLQYVPPDREQCTVLGDAFMLRRAIGNLIDNALRYTPTGGAITIQLEVEGSGVRFTIEDTGPGIPKHDIPLEPFHRSDSSRNPGYGGTGLGFTIAQRIVRAH